ncbi:hypothetical protein ABH15_12050 [Methanoculleus taiwanensis]|uniref:Uncharacterized protein n=1 Tax=Methanoculleus taiwanensis TaxID=1550565 RepID=A0A498H0M2_9EURY|nr:hypothetical protein [Methanoculleus taiwanensis]RXE55570.1 hypothetical protein ABH15_12050 [Methanoculleus taiwanensis]
MTDEELFDLLVPPGVPRSIIFKIPEKFDVEVVKRPRKMYFANMDGDARELLAFRGRREVVEEVQQYLFTELAEFIKEE